MNGWVGTDTNGYNFAPELLSATEEGRWVTYVFANPESGGLRFRLHRRVRSEERLGGEARGGCSSPRAGTSTPTSSPQAMVATAAHVFPSGGAGGHHCVLRQSRGPILRGCGRSSATTTAPPTLKESGSRFIADENGTVIDHYDKALVGTDIKDLLGTDSFEVTAEGNWVTTEDARVWVVGQDGMIFGSGWRSGHDETGG